MRIGVGLAAGAAVLAVAVGTAWSAAPKPGAVAAAPAGPVSTAQMPAGPNRLRPTGLMNRVEALTKDECSQLGGAVTSEDTRLCDSGSVCIRADQHGVVHRVCISKAD